MTYKATLSKIPQYMHEYKLGGPPLHLNDPEPGTELTPLMLEQRPGFQEIKDRVRSIPVCFVTPDSDFLLDARVFPFLGINSVAHQLIKNGNSVYALDCSKFGNQEDIVRDFIQGNPHVKVFALTATSPQIPAAVRIRNAIKEADPTSVVILGGPHATMTYTGMKEDQKAIAKGEAPGPRRGTHAFLRISGLFDKLVIGDGELAIFEALDSTNPERIIDAGDIKSKYYIKKGELDNLFDPARFLFDHDSYKFYINDDGEKYRAFSVIGQFGCPFECGFCCGRDSHVLRFPRTRTVQNVIDEIEKVMIEGQSYTEPFRGVMFYDDELNAVKGNLEELCRGLIELQKRLGIEMRFRGFVKADLFTKEQAELMYQAGFRVLLTGVESGSDQILLAMKKRTSRVINSRCIELAHAAGLRVKALMSIGHPGESKKTIAESVEWVKSNLRDGDEVDWTIITQYPGSPYYDHSFYDSKKDAWKYTTEVKLPNGKKRKLTLWSREIDFATESEFYKGKPGDYRAYVWTRYLSPEQLVAERDKAEAITRRALNLPELKSEAALQYEHSMGQGLPSNILRNSGIIYQAI